MYLRIMSTIAVAVLLGIFYKAVVKDSAQIASEDTLVSGISYPLFDPEMAPDEIRDQVMKGYGIMLETKQHLPEYAGDKISCTHCHFSAGNSFGGKSNGFSLVGVNHKYPVTLESGKQLTLADRINGCFMRSLNGKPLPVDSTEMKAMIAYLNWISSGIPKRADYPWMGVKKLRSNHVADAKNGALIYGNKCALCHGKNGEGQQRPYDLSYPPLWGENSFNDGAGMHRPGVFAYFVYENMPYDDPRLTVEEALDVAAFVTSQDRPKYVPPQE